MSEDDRHAPPDVRATRERIEQWAEVLDDSTYYEILGVLEIAGDASIKQAFHEFALAFHPDSHLDADPETLARVRRVFQRGAEAYRVLSHPELRPKYDLAVAKGLTRLETDAIVKRPGQGTAKSLDELAKSAAARLHAQKADELINRGDLRGAKRELQLAVHQDGGNNPELSDRLDALDLALFAMGE
jgi:DnaJ-class molecular chaperone